MVGVVAAYLVDRPFVQARIGFSLPPFAPSIYSAVDKTTLLTLGRGCKMMVIDRPHTAQGVFLRGVYY